MFYVITNIVESALNTNKTGLLYVNWHIVESGVKHQ